MRSDRVCRSRNLPGRSMTERSPSATIIQLSPRQMRATWFDAAFEVLKWRLDNFERFYGLARPTAKIYRFPARKNDRP